MGQNTLSGIFVKPGLVIPEAELSERFIQSSGPGGQNVNKVASAVQLSFDVARSPSLSYAVRAALLASGGARLSKEGVLTITARRFREQERNRADARARLAEIVLDAATPQKPRRATRPTLASKKRRIEGKKRRAGLKRDRSRPLSDS
jgi:ribosome-associated protein